MQSKTRTYRNVLAGIIVCFVLCPRFAFSQSFLNGSFESNTGSCLYNISNASFSTNMFNSTGFGTANQLDIVQTSCGYGAAQNGNWFIAMAVDITNSLTDGFSLTLSSPLLMGNSYNLTFYDRGWAPYNTNILDVGLSTTAGTFGSLIYTSPLPTIGTWNMRTVNFIAPNSGQYLTLRTVAGSYGWTHVDNFQMATVLPADQLVFYGFPGTGNSDSLLLITSDFKNFARYELHIMNSNGDYITTGNSGFINPAISEYHIVLNHGINSENYYRMEFTHYDGSISFSKSIMISQKKNDREISFEVFPNPSSGVVTLNIPFDFSDFAEGKLVIYNSNGQKMMEQVCKRLSDPIVLNLSLPGLYFVQLRFPDHTTTRKLIIR